MANQSNGGARLAVSATAALAATRAAAAGNSSDNNMVVVFVCERQCLVMGMNRG